MTACYLFFLKKPVKESIMELGAFSISLAVKNIEVSRAFYEKFGFKVIGGEASRNWLILRNGDHTIGLFQGMFEKNTLTFNPGWDKNAGQVDTFFEIKGGKPMRGGHTLLLWLLCILIFHVSD